MKPGARWPEYDTTSEPSLSTRMSNGCPSVRRRSSSPSSTCSCAGTQIRRRVNPAGCAVDDRCICAIRIGWINRDPDHRYPEIVHRVPGRAVVGGEKNLPRAAVGVDRGIRQMRALIDVMNARTCGVERAIGDVLRDVVDRILPSGCRWGMTTTPRRRCCARRRCRCSRLQGALASDQFSQCTLVSSRPTPR